jgi:glycosyltransferase involved in cell wall biosynthesis
MPLRLKRRFDLYFGSDPLNAFAGIILRRMGFARRVIFYKIDYVPSRFSNPILNALYSWIDRKSASDADWTWNLAEAMIRARRKQGIRVDNQLVVPIGCHFERISRPSLDEVNRSKLVYMGSLRRGQGIELVVDTFRAVLEKLSEAELVIVGSGPLQESLREKVTELGLNRQVSFIGEVPDHRQVEHILTTCGIGLATYEPLPDSYTYFTEPGKVKVYLACGLPVIITGVPEISGEVKKRGAGMVIGYDSDDLAAAVMTLARNKQSYASARDSAISFAAEFTWESVFTRAFQSMSSDI